MSLQWSDNAKIFSFTSKNAYLTPASFAHFFSGVLAQAICQKYIKISPAQILIILNELHIIEELLENTQVFSLEHIFSKIVNCKNKFLLEKYDDDILQNSIFDNISFFVGTLLALYFNLHNTNDYFLMISVIVFLTVYTLLCHYYNKKKL